MSKFLAGGMGGAGGGAQLGPAGRACQPCGCGNLPSATLKREFAPRTGSVKPGGVRDREAELQRKTCCSVDTRQPWV